MTAQINDWAMIGVLILGAILILATIVLLWQANRAPLSESPFNATQIFQDDKGRTSGPRLVYIIAAFAGIWVMIFMTLDHAMTAEIIGVVLGILMLGKVGSQWIDTKAPPQPATSEETTFKRTISSSADPSDITAPTNPAPDPRRKT